MWKMSALLPRDVEDAAGFQDAARAATAEIISYCNDVRLHSAIDGIAPRVKLEGREAEIFAERDRKLEDARQRGAAARATWRAETEAAEQNTTAEGPHQAPTPEEMVSCEATAVPA